MKKKTWIRMLAVLLALALGLPLLSGCKDDLDLDMLSDREQNTQDVDDSWISGVRTGILRQGISGQFKSYECTDQRVYFMTDIDGIPMLYSMEHDSDILEPMCSLINCDHEGPGCNAFYSTNGNICIFDESLYVESNGKLYQVDPQNGDRVQILDLAKLFGEKFDGFAEPKLWNGVFSFYLTDFIDEWDVMGHTAAQTKYVPYYYLLDGSMGEPQPMVRLEDVEDPATGERLTASLIAQYNDGETFIMRGPGQEKRTDAYQLYTWNPQKNTYEQFADATLAMDAFYEPSYPVSNAEKENYQQFLMLSPPVARIYDAMGEGYWGTDGAIILQPQKEGWHITDNILCKYDYANGKAEKLLSTGLEGSYRLCCFPDCFVLIETVTDDDKIPDAPRIRVYGWDMELLGECYIEHEISIMPQDLICGETANRIYLASRYVGIPEYYIDKAELDSDLIPIHELSYSNVNVEDVYQKRAELANNELEAMKAENEKIWEELMQQTQ